MSAQDDRNFYVEVSGAVEGAPEGYEPPPPGPYVLKVHNGVESTNVGIIDAQNGAMAHLVAGGFTCPHAFAALPSAGGALIAFAELPLKRGGTRRHAVRLLNYLPGKLLSDVPFTPGLLRAVGHSLGLMDASLQEFDHEATHRTHIWDLANTAAVGDFVEAVTDAKLAEVIREVIAAYADRVATAGARGDLRKGVIHNDANDHNLIVDDAGERVVAVIDFGDTVHTHVVNELGIAMAYAIMDKPDLVATASHMVKGYCEAFPLNEAELSALYVLVAARLACSATMGAYSYAQDPGNEYLLLHAAPAFRTLSAWWALDEAEVTAALHSAAAEAAESK